MARRRDPVEEADDGYRDLYEIATWEVRTPLDRLSMTIYRVAVLTTRTVIIALALLIFASLFALTGLGTITNPLIGAFVLVSILPALAFAAYIWHTDVTVDEPLSLLVATFLLGILFASFAAVVNSLARPAFQAIPVVGVVLFFYLVVAPIEEVVKWLAVRLYAYGSDRFDAVIDGAVYGAMAGLGFATIENAIYITQQYEAAEAGVGIVQAIAGTTASRTFVGPGHVIYSAFSGYYLGLAKFNRDRAGPIIIKGLLVAILLHATYNTLVTMLPILLELAPASDVSLSGAVFGAIVSYNIVFGYALYRKLKRYRDAYQSSRGSQSISFGDERP